MADVQPQAPQGTEPQTTPQGGNSATPPPATPNAADQARILQEARDSAAAAARRQAESEYSKRMQAEVAAAKAEALKQFGIESDEEAAEWAQRIAKEREAKQASEGETAKQLKQLQAQQAKLEQQLAEAQGRAQAEASQRLGESIENAILKGAEGLAISPEQIVLMFRGGGIVRGDPDTGEVGIVELDDTDDPPWAEGYRGVEGIQRYVREWLAREEQVNLRRPAGAPGVGSTPPGGSATSAEIEALEKRVKELREANAKGDRRAGTEAVRAQGELKRLKEATQAR